MTMHCQLCLTPFNADGSHPPSNCPVYTGAPVQGHQLPVGLDQIASRLDRIEAVLQELLSRTKVESDASLVWGRVVRNDPISWPIGFALAVVKELNDPRFLDCNGQLVSKADYPELAAVLGDAYGRSTEEWFRMPPDWGSAGPNLKYVLVAKE